MIQFSKRLRGIGRVRAHPVAIADIFPIKIFARFAFPQKQPEDKGGERGYAGGRQKGGLTPEAARYDPSSCGAYGGSDAGAGADGSMRQIEPAGSCGEICYHQHRYHSDNDADDPV
jgi:hypothetical protein